ncbi:hypothetical protein K1719_047344 [Acacia pycnantha]|nr:hypothetical protein K1719_047344 [Acacia pycnantha]
MAHRSSSSSITYKWPYDVFLSFYGNDTCLGFISHLYESLRRSGIHAFIDYKMRDELRHLRGSYTEALARLEERFKDERHKVEKWRQALSHAADLKGLSSHIQISLRPDLMPRHNEVQSMRRRGNGYGFPNDLMQNRVFLSQTCTSPTFAITRFSALNKGTTGIIYDSKELRAIEEAKAVLEEERRR